MKRFKDQIISELEKIKSDGLLRKMDILESGDFPYITVNGRHYINFSSNNYLALNGHKLIKEAMSQATEKYGTSASASRLISGNIEIFEQAEAILALFKGKESALIFNSGYQANLSVISTLFNEKDVIFSDELNHASIIDGCRLSKAKIFVYRHNDMNHLEDILQSTDGRRKVIITDGVFSMDGDIADLPQICYLAERYDAIVIVDDAHSTGVLGVNGAGTESHFGLKNDYIFVLGTGGKALGGGGAFFCCPKYVRDYLINRCRGFIYSTALPPSVPAGLIAAINIIKNETVRVSRLKELSLYIHKALKRLNINTSSAPSHITPIIIGDSLKTLNLAQNLLKNHIYVKAIRPPTVPPNTSRIRISLTSLHTEADIDKLISLLSPTAKEINVYESKRA